MSCAFDKERLTAYYDGELGPDEKSEVERHISSCSECLRDLGEIKSAALLVRGLPRHPAPPSVAEGVSRAVAAAGRAARFRVLRGTLLWATAAAAVLLIVLNVIFFAGFQERAAPETAATSPRSATPGLAWKGAPADEGEKVEERGARAARLAAPQAPAPGEAADGKQDRRRSVLREQTLPPALAAGDAADETARRAASRDAGAPPRDRMEQQTARNALKAPETAPAAPPPAAAEPTPAPRPRATEAEARKSGVKAEGGDPARQDRLLAEADKADRDAGGKVAEKMFAGGRGAGGPGEAKEAQPLVLTLAASDPALARSRVLELLKKVGAAAGEGSRKGAAGEPEEDLSPSRREAAEARSELLKAAARAAAPLTVDLTARQLAALRAEIRKEKSILVVRKQAEEREAADRAGEKAKPDAAEVRALAAAPAAPKPEERHPSPAAPAVDRPERSKAAPAEPAAPEAVEGLPPGAGEPALYRLTVEFTVLEGPPGDGKK